MFSTTLKQSVATLGVVAGLLAAAGPASAGTMGVNTGHEGTSARFLKAPASPTSEVFTSVSNVAPPRGDATTIWVWHEAARDGIALNTFGGNDTFRGRGITCLDQDLVTLKGPTNSPSCGVSQSDSLENTMVSGYNVQADAEGTQLGVEGV